MVSMDRLNGYSQSTVNTVEIFLPNDGYFINGMHKKRLCYF